MMLLAMTAPYAAASTAFLTACGKTIARKKALG
jgi:hypothetical protein